MKSNHFENRIFLIWTGPNKMSENRHNALMSFYENSGSEVILIDQSNLNQWLVKKLHSSYNYLSYTHRADYLRCYFMHNYGGGYSDIKFCTFDWSKYFENLQISDSQILMSGYPERKASDIGSYDKHIRNSYSQLPGMGQFIFKPKSELTYQWISSVHSYLDSISCRLVQYPGTYHPRAINGGLHDHNILVRIRFLASRYPLSWNWFLGRILHPLTYRFKDRLSLNMPYVDTLTNYR